LPELHPSSHHPTKKRLDERNGFDRRDQQKVTETLRNLRRAERRQPEEEEDIHRRQIHTILMQRFRSQKKVVVFPVLVLTALLVSAGIVAINNPSPLPMPTADCLSPPAPMMDWSNCIKPNLNLEKRNLSQSHLRNAQLVNANFSGANLTASDMAYSDLRASDLSNADLKETLLTGVNLQYADLTGADLTNADLSFADLRGADISKVTFNNTRLHQTIWTTGSVCSKDAIDVCFNR
jgi:hypothetical protein